MPVRTLNRAAWGPRSSWRLHPLAARNGADVINLSTFLPEGGNCSPDSEDPEHLVEAALEEAHDLHGVTIVAAAGNFGLPCVGYPASSPFTIAVGASGPPADADVRGVFSDDRSSHWGPEIDIAAPGVDIVSSCPVPTLSPTGFCPGGPYSISRGTSFAAPIVTGAAALLIARDPGRTNEDVRERLRATALDLPDEQTPNWDGAGRLDLGAALGAGPGIAIIDVTSPDTSGLDLGIVVGDAAARYVELCSGFTLTFTPLAFTVRLASGVCGVLAPRANQPWSLYGSSANRKVRVSMVGPSEWPTPYARLGRSREFHDNRQ
jgi:subtilisin family serine protease